MPKINKNIENIEIIVYNYRKKKRMQILMMCGQENPLCAGSEGWFLENSAEKIADHIFVELIKMLKMVA